MIRRIFTVLIWIAGAWAALLIWFWPGVSLVLSVPVTLILMALPMAVVVTLYYVSGI